MLADDGLPTLRATPAAVTLFVVLVLGLSWLRFLPPIAAHGAGIDVPAAIPDIVLPTLGTFAPLWAALVVSSRPLGGPGVGALLRQILRWKVAWQWYALVLAGPVLLFSLALAAALLAGASPPSIGLDELAGAAAIFVAALIFVTGEEYGWRGYLQPALQARWPALVAALLVGGVWAAWHAPLFLDPEAIQSGVPPLAFLALGVGLAVLMAWIYNSTGDGLPLVILAHAAMNASLGAIALALPDPDSVARYVTACAVAVWLAAIAITTMAGPLRLSTARTRRRPHSR